MRRVVLVLAVLAAAATAQAQPVADAGPDQTVSIGSLVQLNGSGSTDPMSMPLTYAWSLMMKPAGSAAVLSNSNVVQPTFVADVVGTYVAQLIVNNGAMSSAADTVTITVVLPVADAGADRTVSIGTVVQLDGSASADAGGLPLTYAWTLMTKPAGSAAVLSNPTAVKPTFVADVVGTYEAQLTVNNGTANSAPDSVTITGVLPPAPVADAGPDENVSAGASVQLDGSGSTDPSALPLTYAWTLVAKPSGSAAVLSNPTAVQPTFVADVVGTYMARLIVNNGAVSSNPDTVTITAVLPVANAGPDQTVSVGATVQLDGSASTDASSLPLTYAWTLISKPTGSAAVLSNSNAVQPTFVADVLGTYVVRLIVNNGTANSAPDSVTIAAGQLPASVPAVDNWGLVVMVAVLICCGLPLLRQAGVKVEGAASSAPSSTDF